MDLFREVDGWIQQKIKQSRDDAKPEARTPVKQRKAPPSEPRKAEPRESREGAEQAAAQ